MNIKKAIFPVGGLGTRFLPATKSMPKEMLPIVDKPLIQYAVEEAANAGIEQFIFVTSRGKSAIENHFDHSFELENKIKTTLFLKSTNKKNCLMNAGIYFFKRKCFEQKVMNNSLFSLEDEIILPLIKSNKIFVIIY